MVMSEQLVGSFEVVMRGDGEGMHYHVRSHVDMLTFVFIHNSVYCIVNLGIDRVHILVEKSPVEDLFCRSLRQTFMGIPVESEFIVHRNIAFSITADNTGGGFLPHSEGFVGCDDGRRSDSPVDLHLTLDERFLDGRA